MQYSGLFISPKDMIDRPANPNLLWNNYEQLDTWNLCEIVGFKYPLWHPRNRPLRSFGWLIT